MTSAMPGKTTPTFFSATSIGCRSAQAMVSFVTNSPPTSSGKILGGKAPFRHDFDEATIAHQFRLYQRRHIA
jgi:hypothetical protein